MKSGTGEKLALQSVNVTGKLDGLLLSTTIRQNYHNNTGKNLEIVYTFPVGWGSSLLGLDVEIGGKRLKGVVIEKKEAEAKYEKAIDEGDTPIMVQESSPGLYTANLGNIKDKEAVSVEIHCAQLLRFEQDQIRVKIPTVIAPRYGNAHKDGGLAPHETDAVDFNVRYPLTINLNVLGEASRAKITCPSHKVSIKPFEDGISVLLESGAMLDRDFILLLNGLSGHSFALSTTDGEQYMMLASFCPNLPEKAAPLLLKILVDCSGSMSGDSIFQAKKALETVLQELKSEDYISYSKFGSDVLHESKQMEVCSQETLQRFSRIVAQTDANMGGTEMKEALLSTYRDVAVPKDVAYRPCILLITDDLIWGSDEVLKAGLESGHRIFAVGVGSAPAENPLRALAERTGGACEFVSPNEDIEAAIVRIFHRMRVAQTNKLRIDWGSEPLWQSPLPVSVFDGETLHLSAIFSAPPTGLPKLSWESDGHTEHAQPDTISNTENRELSRLVGAQQMDAAPTQKEALELALKYQLVNRLTALFLVYVREGEEKAEGLPELHQVPQMMTAGSHGYGTVMGCAGIGFASMYGLASAIPGIMFKQKNYLDSIITVSTPKDLLEFFDKQALTCQNFAEVLNLLVNFTGTDGLTKLVDRLAKQENISTEQAWAFLLDWLMEQLVNDYLPSRQAKRLLRSQTSQLTKEQQSTLHVALSKELPSVGIAAWQ
jgi:Ca-activated chloride channel family protein